MNAVIETVDLGSASAPERLAAALAATGFAQLTGHGLDASVLGRMRSQADSFFGRELSEKSQFVHADPAANRGYRARGSEALSYSLGEKSPPDLFESFNAAPEPVLEHRLCQLTPWPDEIVPDFSTAIIDAFGDFAALAARLDGMIGEVVDISWLRERSGEGPDMLANINYRPAPDGTEVVLDGQQRMGAHSDYTTFTLLAADPVPGLQIISPKGEWVDVIPEPGALLLNVGDLLAMLTNDAWPSTLHRVVPMSAGAAPNRRSVAFFHYPNLDVEISPLSGFVSDATPARYEPVTVEAHLLAKLVAPKVKEASTATSTAAGRPTT